MRVQANFADYVPLSLLLLAFAELQGRPVWLIHTLCAVLVVGRLVHGVPQLIFKHGMTRGGHRKLCHLHSLVRVALECRIDQRSPKRTDYCRRLMVSTVIEDLVQHLYALSERREKR